VKRLFDELFAALHLLGEDVRDEAHWHQRTASEREAVIRNLLCYWLLAPPVLLVFIWLIAQLSTNR